MSSFIKQRYYLDDPKDSSAMSWIKNYKELPNKKIIHDTSLRNYYGETMAMIWVQHVLDEPPFELVHDPVIKNCDGNTILMIWITEVLGRISKGMIKEDSESESEEVNYYPDVFQPRKTKKYYDHYIEPFEHKSEIIDSTYLSEQKTPVREMIVPKWMLHDPKITSKNGNTAAMIWAMNVDSEVPHILKHSDDLKNYSGMTLSDVIETYSELRRLGLRN